MNQLVPILIFLIIFVLTCGIKAQFRYQPEKRENLVYQIDNINSDSCTADKLINVWFAGQSIGCGKEYDLALFSDGKAPKLSLDRANIVSKFLTYNLCHSFCQNLQFIGTETSGL